MLYLYVARLRSPSSNVKIKHSIVFVLCKVWLEDDINGSKHVTIYCQDLIATLIIILSMAVG